MKISQCSNVPVILEDRGGACGLDIHLPMSLPYARSQARRHPLSKITGTLEQRRISKQGVRG